MTVQKLLFCILLLFTTGLYGQKLKTLTYIGGNTDSLPNIQLYLHKDSTFHLKLLGNSCWSWQFLGGTYFFKNDSLVLLFQTFLEAPSCQIIDTFHRKRILKVLCINDKGKVADKLPIELNNDTTNIGYMPLNYVDTPSVNHTSSRIDYTYYAPFFTTKSLKVQFYKPQKKLDRTYTVILKVEGNALIPNEKNKPLFKPFERLIRQ